MPLARRDVERLRQILGLQRRLRDLTASPRARRALSHRSIFREALTWLDIHGAVPDIVEQWKVLFADTDASEEVAGEVKVRLEAKIVAAAAGRTAEIPALPPRLHSNVFTTIAARYA